MRIELNLGVSCARVRIKLGTSWSELARSQGQGSKSKCLSRGAESVRIQVHSFGTRVPQSFRAIVFASESTDSEFVIKLIGLDRSRLELLRRVMFTLTFPHPRVGVASGRSSSNCSAGRTIAYIELAHLNILTQDINA